MKRKAFTLIMVLMMIMTMMPAPGAHNHAHAEDGNSSACPEGQHTYTALLVPSFVGNYDYHRTPCDAAGNVITDTSNTYNRTEYCVKKCADCGYVDMSSLMRHDSTGMSRSIKRDGETVTVETKCCKCGLKLRYEYTCGENMVSGVITDNKGHKHLVSYCEDCMAYNGTAGTYSRNYTENGVKYYFSDIRSTELGDLRGVWGYTNSCFSISAIEHTFDANGKCECGYECPHAQFVYEHIEGTEGYKAIHDWYCPDCGYVLVNDAKCFNNDNNGDGICDKCKYEYEHKNHDWSNKDGICAKEGCGVAHEPHEWDKGVCTVCGAAHKCDFDNLEYKHNEGTATHDWLCPVCGYLFADDAKCIDNDPDGDGICDKCEYEYEHKNHKWSNYEGKCTVCGESHTHDRCRVTWENSGYVPSEAVCTICGYNLIGQCPDLDSDGHCDTCKECLPDDRFELKYDDTYHWYEHYCGEIWDYYGDPYEEHDLDAEGKCTVCEFECAHAQFVFEHVEGTEGYKAIHDWYCPDCGYVLVNDALCYNNDNNGDGICDKCKYEYEHKNCRGGEATCTEKAICEICKKPYGEALGHGELEYVHIEGTEGVASMHMGSCSVCEEVIFVEWHCADNDKDHNCDNCGYELSEHNFVGVSDGVGKHTMKCDFCGLTGTTSYCEDYTEDGLCDKCGYELPKPEPHEHDYVSPQSNNNGTHTLSCNCGLEVTLNCGDYNGDRFCDSCGYEMMPPAPPHEHNYVAYSNNDGTHTLSCNCGLSYDPMKCMDYDGDGLCDSCDYELFHAGGTPTCAEQAICQNCGLPYGKTLPHTWKFNEEASTLNVEKKTFNIVIDCSECGKVYPIATSYNAKTEVTQEGDCDTAELTKFYTSGSVWGVAFEIEEIVETKAATGEHNYEVVKSEPATCEYPAYYWYECSVCGAEKNGEDPTGALAEHDYEVVKSEPATCEYPAYYWYECSVCGAEKNGEDPTGALAEHDYEVVKSEPANCIYPAYYWYECSVCGAEKNGEEGEATGIHVDLDNDYVCDVCDFVMDNPCDHEGKGTYTFTVEANCSNEGYVEVYCANCEEVISKEILEVNDAHVFYNGVCLLCGGKEEDVTCDHEGKGTYTFTVEATCSAEGVVEVYCSGCAKLISSEILEKNDAHVFYNGVCLLCGEAEVKECEHNYELVKEQKADCQFPAYYWYKCSECGNELNYEDKTGALGDHDYEVVKSEPATCQFPAYYWYECTVCGAEMNREEGDVGDHNYELVKEQKADCQFPAYYWFECTECGAELNYEDKTGALGDHDYEVVKSEPATCQYPAYYWYECSVCGAEMNREEGDVGDHNYELVNEQKADCQFPAYYWFECTECGAELNYEDKTGALGDHTWDDGEVTTEPTVDAEGVKTFTCDVCGETKTESVEKLDHEHDYKAVVTAPTCTEAGYTTYTCECGESYVADEVEALGHNVTVKWDFNEDVTKVLKIETCNVCGKVTITEEDF